MAARVCACVSGGVLLMCLTLFMFLTLFIVKHIIWRVVGVYLVDKKIHSTHELDH